jgi:hypothetical protein
VKLPSPRRRDHGKRLGPEAIVSASRVLIDHIEEGGFVEHRTEGRRQSSQIHEHVEFDAPESAGRGSERASAKFCLKSEVASRV